MLSKAQGQITGMKGKLRHKQLARGCSESFCDVTRLGMLQKGCSSGRHWQSEATMDHWMTVGREGEITLIVQIPKAGLKVQLLGIWGRP